MPICDGGEHATRELGIREASSQGVCGSSAYTRGLILGFMQSLELGVLAFPTADTLQPDSPKQVFPAHETISGD